MKKIIAIATTLTVAAMVAGPGTAQALTAAELQAQIDALLSQLTQLQSQLAVLQGGGGGVSVTGCTIASFDRNLKVGMTGADVKCLQIVLNSAADTMLASSGVGSSGQETQYFGPLTQAAVVKFQEKYASEVLASWGLTSGTGFVGSTTRTKLNQLLGGGAGGVTAVCGNGICQVGETAASCPADCGTTPVSASGLTVALSYDTPPAATVADNGVSNFTKFTLSAGSQGAVNISKIYVTRSGLSANSDIENIKIIDAETGGYVGSIGSLNVDNRAMITFVPQLEIPAGTTKSYYIRASILDGATAGINAKLSINDADDVVSNASGVYGNFPVIGNPMTVVTLTIGTATVSEDTTVDSKPDVGDTDVQLLAFKVAAGSTEAITIDSVTVKKAGTADASDIENIELYSATDNRSLATVSAWSGEEKATWGNLNIVVPKGKNHKFKVLVDIVGGVSSTSLTVNADLVDGSDVLMSVKGNVYGFYLDPDRSPSSWDGKGTDQTINAGALNISKSANTPATGNISSGDEKEVTRWDFEAKGEDVKITNFVLAWTNSGSPNNLTSSDFTNVSLYDEDGNIVAGPQDCADDAVTFTDTFIVPAGTHEFYVAMTIADSADTGSAFKVGTSISTTNTVATGMTSNDTITVTPDATTVDGNVLTIAAGSLVVTTLAYPPTRSVPAPTSDFVWATFSLDATASGEDVQVTAITVTDSIGTGAAVGNIDSSELWADLTDGTSSRGDVYETKISDTEQPSATTQAYTLNQTLVIDKGTFVKIALVADLVSGAAGNHTFSIVSDNVTATGAETSESITPSYSVSAAQTISVGSATVTISPDSSRPDSSIIIGGKTATLAVFRIAETTNVEDLDLDQMTVAVTGGDYVDTLYLYDGDTLIGAKPGSEYVTYIVADGAVTVPANGNKKITVKGKFRDVDGTTVTNDTEAKAQLGDSDAVQTTGLSSGTSVDSSTQTATGNTMYLLESRPYFSLNSSSGSGTLTARTDFLVAIFDVTAEDTEDVTFVNAEGNAVTMQISAFLNDTTQNQLSFTLKDGSGNTLASSQSADSYFASQTLDSTVVFGFSTNSFTVPAGQTKQLYVYCNTTDFEDDGDSIQIWLDDATATNVDWGINGTGSYNHADIIWRGDIYGGSFVNPS